ncbi:unnamed protein product [Vitrella brassicaformis CCMP3155]|uniref:Uncharacterized protein n=1 Tax=Vitrella brassicaformis (strain CCMP3155) TaxID=1169540 RepID=A0A0G4GGQ1_VITBC|nr:unnamed protein product [Vitrella brassicaformis CCMP3155]|eukprot:CEM28802.1 unnamed protein product [Vitrella brassicaformis CCMP3155]
MPICVSYAYCSRGDTRVEGAGQMVTPQSSGVPAAGSPQRDGSLRHDTTRIAQWWNGIKLIWKIVFTAVIFLAAVMGSWPSSPSLASPTATSENSAQVMRPPRPPLPLRPATWLAQIGKPSNVTRLTWPACR